MVEALVQTICENVQAFFSSHSVYSSTNLTSGKSELAALDIGAKRLEVVFLSKLNPQVPGYLYIRNHSI